LFQLFKVVEALNKNMPTTIYRQQKDYLFCNKGMQLSQLSNLPQNSTQIQTEVFLRPKPNLGA
jgi:DNA gyrase/topoisomerase IV subunit B